MTSKPITLAPATVDPRILRVRGVQVLVDADLAEIYGVSTKALNQAVKRNAERFPEDFRFQLTAAEREEVVTNCDHLTRLNFSPVLPWAFTEHGSIMAASVLNSQRAVEMSVFVGSSSLPPSPGARSGSAARASRDPVAPQSWSVAGKPDSECVKARRVLLDAPPLHDVDERMAGLRVGQVALGQDVRVEAHLECHSGANRL